MMRWRRLAYLLPWRRRAAERDMQDELQSIRAMADPGTLGNLTLAAENARAEWGWTRLDDTLRDIRYALRSLRRSPGFAATAILSLALGIGANTALFTLIDAVMWRLLPVHAPERLLVLTQRQDAASENGFTYQQYALIRDNTRVLTLAAYARVRLNVRIDGQQEPTAEGQLISGSYFPLLGVPPAAGRALGPEDDRVPLGHPVAMISYAYWQRRFGLDPGVIGRPIALSGTPFTIVGVTPPEFFGVEVGTAPDLFVPIMMQPVVMPVSENLLVNPHLYLTWVHAIGRLEPGVSPAQAAAALSTLADQAEMRPPDKSGGRTVKTTLTLSPAATGLSDLREQFALPLRILIAVVGIVLLIACANTGSLVLARSTARRAEFALRAALGASRSRLIRQVLIEGLLLAGLAGWCGVALAYYATRVLVAYVSAGRSPIVLDLAPDMRVLLFTTAVSLVAGMLFASVPAFRASRFAASATGPTDLAATRQAVGSLQPAGALVICQVVLSLLLLVTAGLFVRSLQNLHRRDAGTDRSQILIVRVEPRGSDQRNAAGVTDRLDRIYRDLLARVEQLPGVQAASLARTAPLTPIGFSSPVTAAATGERTVPILTIYPHYFATMGLALTRGRDVDERDLRPDSPFVALVNETFVREVLLDREPLGHAGAVSLAGQTLEIIGVVQDSPYPDLRSAPRPTLYQPFRQTHTGRGQMVLHVRVAGGMGGVLPQLRGVVQRVDRDTPIFEVHSLKDEVDATLVRERLVATLSSLFGVVALILVSVGLFGLMSFTVSRRTAEIGLRMALGAGRSDVAWLITRQTLVLVLAGIAIALPIAWLLARLASRQLSTMLFGVSPIDPVTVAAAAALLIVVATAAGSLPARRAARIDPIVALRND
jgi:predicted permease